MSTNRRILHNLIKHEKNRLQDPLTALIDEYLIKRDKPEYRHKRLPEVTIPTLPRVRPLGRFSPSKLCGCQRQAALSFLGVEGFQKTNPDTELIFEDGNWRHYKWGHIFRDMEAVLGRKRFRVVSIEYRVEFRKLYITGHLDAHVQIFVDGEWIDYIVDFKGANGFSWERAYRLRKPYHEHELQLMGYLKARRVRRGLLLYDSKESNKFYIFPVELTDEAWDEVRRWTKKVIQQVEDNELPPRHPECSNGTFLSNRCPFKKLCFGDMSDRQVERMAYKGFTSLDDLWERGLEIEKTGAEEHD